MAGWTKVWRPKLEAYVYIVHWRDINKVRHNLTTHSEKERDELIAQLDDEPGVDPKTLFGQYAMQWLAVKKPTFRRQTYRTYHSKMNAHIVAMLGHYRLRDVKRSMLRKFLASRLEAGQAPRSVQALNLLLTQIFDQAWRMGSST